MVSTLSTLGYGPSVPAKMQAKDVSKNHCIHVVFIVYVCCCHIRSTNQSNGHRLTSGHCLPFIPADSMAKRSTSFERISWEECVLIACVRASPRPYRNSSSNDNNNNNTFIENLIPFSKSSSLTEKGLVLPQ